MRRALSGTIRALTPLRPARPVRPRTVQQRFRIGRQVGVDDEFEVRQVDAAGGDVGRDADAGAAVAHRLQRMGALVLAEFARQRHDREAAVVEARGQMVDGSARRAEDDGVLRLVDSAAR